MKIKVEKNPNKKKLEEMKVTSWPVWTKEASCFSWHYDAEETCYFLEGDVTVRTPEGEVALGPGDLVTFPKGLKCEWEVKKPVRKHYRSK